MLKSIHHIAIAVPSIDDVFSFYQDTLGLPFSHFEDIPDQKVKVAIFKVGEVRIELLEPLSDDSPISKFIEKNKGRGGLHHLAFETDDIHKELGELKQKEVQLLNQEPRVGAEDCLIAFLHPKSSAGVLTELIQPRPEE